MVINGSDPMEVYENRTIETVTEAVKNYVDDVRAVFPVVKAFLFGSWAKGTNTKDSDVDVCFFIQTLVDRIKQDEIKLKILRLKWNYLGMFIEPHIINAEYLTSNNSFILEILRTGIEI